ncbi:MAG: pre-16S rRNA-processing nuclease YqgF [Armatimonadota bacterium]
MAARQLSLSNPRLAPADLPRVLAIDPGRDKCGIAVVDARKGILARGVVPAGVIGTIARKWAAEHRAELLVVGSGTAPRKVRADLQALDLPLEVMAEEHTTRRARERYFQENPPRGWRRLIPRGLLTPPVPVDDYAAVLIGEGYLANLAADGS